MENWYYLGTIWHPFEGAGKWLQITGQLGFFILLKLIKIIQGSSHYQPKQCIVIGEIPQNCHRFGLLDSPKTGNLMTLAIIWENLRFLSYSWFSEKGVLCEAGNHCWRYTHFSITKGPGKRVDPHDLGMHVFWQQKLFGKVVLKLLNRRFLKW